MFKLSLNITCKILPVKVFLVYMRLLSLVINLSEHELNEEKRLFMHHNKAELEHSN